MMKKTITILFISLISTSAFAQFSLSAQYSYLKLFGGSEIKNSGFGLRGDYQLDNEIIVYGGFNYYLAYTEEGEYSGRALSNVTVPQSIIVDYERELPFTNIYLGAKKYFVGEYDDEDFGLYGLLELGYLITKPTTTYGSYDKTQYTIDVFEEESYSNFLITIGGGVEKGFDFGYIFSDIKLNIPANQENGETVEVELPASFTFNLGYRMPF